MPTFPTSATKPVPVLVDVAAVWAGIADLGLSEAEADRVTRRYATDLRPYVEDPHPSNRMRIPGEYLGPADGHRPVSRRAFAALPLEQREAVAMHYLAHAERLQTRRAEFSEREADA